MAATPRKIARIQARDAVKSASLTVSLREIVEGMPALNTLSVQPLDTKTAYRISRVLRAVNDEMKLFEEQRVALLDKFGTKGDGQYSFETPEAREDFEREYKELLSVEVELHIASIKVDELTGIKIAPADLAALDWLIVGE